MTLPHEAAPAPESIYDTLNTRQLDVLIAKVAAGWKTAAAAAHPHRSPLWEDGRDLLEDLHLAWCAAFAREHPAGADAEATP
jgi:hypothetical protein